MTIRTFPDSGSTDWYGWAGDMDTVARGISNLAATATALAAGSAPTVVRGGTDAAPTFTFGIPAGAQGGTGPAPVLSTTSSTSVSPPAGGNVTFAVPAGHSLTAGMRVYVSSSGTPTVWMTGALTAASTSTSLVVAVDRSNGATAKTDWIISLAGAYGATGSTGATPQISATASSLATGSAPTAVVGGTAANPTIAFGIPTGATGAAGTSVPIVVYANGAWPARSSVIPSGYTGPVYYDSSGTPGAPSPTDFSTTVTDTWWQYQTSVTLSGTVGQVPYISSTSTPALTGATGLLIENGYPRLPMSTPSNYPADNGIQLFGLMAAGRRIPATIDPFGRVSGIQAYIATKAIAWATPNGNSTLTQMGCALSTTGTANAPTMAGTNKYTQSRRVEYLVATASTTAVAGWYDPIARYSMGSGTENGGFHHVVRFGLATGYSATGAGPTRRVFVGLSSVVAAPTDVNPSTLANVLGVGADSTDTNLQFMYRTGTGTVVKVDTGMAKNVQDRAEVFSVGITADPGYGFAVISIKRFSDGLVVTQYTNASVPAAGTMLASRAYASVGGTSNVIGISMMNHYIETDL